MPRLNFRPVRDNGRFAPWVRALRGKSGSYLIKSRLSGEVLYVGESHTGRLYETLTRHFQRWRGPTAGPTFAGLLTAVAVILTPPSKAVAEQDRLIRRHRPEKNTVANPEKAPADDENENPF